MSLAKRNSEAAKAWAAKRRESKERAILLDNKSSSRALRPPVCPEAAMKPPSHAASTSDVDNAKYMENFRAGMSNVYLGLHPQVKDRDLLRPKDQDRGRYLVSNDRRCNARGGASGTIQQEAGPDCTGRASGRIGKRRPERHGPHAENVQRKILLSEEVRSDATGGGVASGWYRGPQDPAGQLVDLSDRNLLCTSVQGDEAVFGCADHALYCVDLSRGLKRRQLYGSRSKPDAGHKEWVSVVAHTAEGNIVSGGMDGKLCLWPRQGGDPGEVQAHTGSISALKADAAGKVITGGYGGALRIWDCRGSGGGRGGIGAPRLSGELSDQSLPAPCMDFAWTESRVMTGHRDGRAGLYDLGTGTMVCELRRGGAHRGCITVVQTLADAKAEGRAGCFVTGGQDGFVRVWDTRIGGPGGDGGNGPGAVMEAPAHRGATGVGAVGGITAVGGDRLASFGADKRICVFELRGGRGRSVSAAERLVCRGGSLSAPSSSLAIEHVFDDHRDFIYCMDFARAVEGAEGVGTGGILVTGGGDGNLLAHDLGSMRLLYGLGCSSAGAVRCAVAGERRLIVGGDDGNAMLYSFDEGNDVRGGARR